MEPEFLSINLSERDAINIRLEEPLVVHLAEEPDVEFDSGTIEMRIGYRPVALSLKQLYELSGRSLPPEFGAFYDRFNVYLISHSVNVSKISGIKTVDQLIYEVKFADGQFDPRITIIDLFPRTSFEKVLDFSFTNQFEAGIDISGHAVPPDTVTEFLDSIDAIQIGADASIKLSSNVKIVGKLSLSVITSKIIATGIYNDYAQWILKPSTNPLLGPQVMMQVLLIPKTVQELRMQCRIAATVSSLFGIFPSTRRSSWVPLTCSL